MRDLRDMVRARGEGVQERRNVSVAAGRGSRCKRCQWRPLYFARGISGKRVMGSGRRRGRRITHGNGC